MVVKGPRRSKQASRQAGSVKVPIVRPWSLEGCARLLLSGRLVEGKAGREVEPGM